MQTAHGVWVYNGASPPFFLQIFQSSKESQLPLSQGLRITATMSQDEKPVEHQQGDQVETKPEPWVDLTADNQVENQTETQANSSPSGDSDDPAKKSKATNGRSPVARYPYAVVEPDYCTLLQTPCA